MFKNKNGERNNLCGENVYRLRMEFPTKLSQRALADRLQLIGIDVDKNAIQPIESGKRFVTDIELSGFAEVFGVGVDRLLADKPHSGEDV